MRIVPIPPDRSLRWGWWLLVYTVVLTLALSLFRTSVAGLPLEAGLALRHAAASLVASVVVIGSGWLGARWVWGLSTLGLASGIILLFVYGSRDMDGWEDLVGFLAMSEAVVIGFALGLIVELASWFVRRRRSR